MDKMILMINQDLKMCIYRAISINNNW